MKDEMNRIIAEITKNGEVKALPEKIVKDEGTFVFSGDKKYDVDLDKMDEI